MQTQQNTVHTDRPAANHFRRLRGMLPDLMLPFVVLACASLPSLVVLVIFKPMLGMSILNSLGYVKLIGNILRITVPLAVLCGLACLVTTRSMRGRILVGATIALLGASFWFITIA